MTAEGAGALREGGLAKEMAGPGWGLGRSDALASDPEGRHCVCFTGCGQSQSVFL